MKHRPFSELTKHWPPERTAKVEAMAGTARAELGRQEREQAPDEAPSQASDAPPRAAQRVIREQP